MGGQKRKVLLHESKGGKTRHQYQGKNVASKDGNAVQNAVKNVKKEAKAKA